MLCAGCNAGVFELGIESEPLDAASAVAPNNPENEKAEAAEGAAIIPQSKTNAKSAWGLTSVTEGRLVAMPPRVLGLVSISNSTSGAKQSSGRPAPRGHSPEVHADGIGSLYPHEESRQPTLGAGAGSTLWLY